ncbi:hypothetical protein [Clostridium manihotivorum]|uniref:Uncharacterized protein n=1 Tax=Clostridium manihotivorum TaxID=2320868 RepID=A0A3R5U475_9CLOT|nr:hypothetical protein [Clostridium manihotivorum]QAA31218.1 hypothetical protein C1I91_05925 [Clostridium manihotivorum]
MEKYKLLNSLDQDTGLKVTDNEVLAVSFLRSYRLLNTEECIQITRTLKQATLRALHESESTLDIEEGGE